MAETDQYDKFCKQEFKDIKDGLKEVSDRLFKTNGKKALTVMVEENAKQIADVTGMLKEHIKISDKPLKAVRKLTLGKQGLEIAGYTGADLLKIGLMVVMVVYIVWSDHGEKVMDALQKGPHPTKVR